MARKVARCLRKNYKKKVKATANSEKKATESANEIAALFNGVGDIEAAKRTVAAAQQGQVGRKNQAKLAHNAKKAVAAIGGKKKLADRKSKHLKRKTLFGDDDDDDDATDDEDDNSEDEEEEDELAAVDENGVMQLPDVNALTTEEQLQKYRTLLRKQQVKEKMTLREHIRELEKRKGAMRGGKHVAEDLRREKRDLGKYIKQLEEEQKKKHANATYDVEVRFAQLESARRDPFLAAAERSKARNRQHKLGPSANSQGIYQAGLGDAFVPNLARNSYGNSGLDNDGLAADELQNMFAHLL